MLDTPRAIIIAALIISATFAFMSRYSLHYTLGNGGGAVLRFNQLTGSISNCIESKPGRISEIVCY